MSLRRECISKGSAVSISLPDLDSGSWLCLCIKAIGPAEAICLSRRRRESERPFPPCLPGRKGHGSNGTADKVFYLTAKTITRTRGRRTAFLGSCGNRACCLTTVTDHSERKTVSPWRRPNAIRMPVPMPRGHFDRVNDAVYDIIHDSRGLDQGDTSCRYAERISGVSI